MDLERKQEGEKYNPFNHLKELQDNWSDEIPEEILHGGQGNKSPRFKVRKNWWQGLFGDFGFLIQGDMLHDSLKQETENFMEKHTGKINNDLTTTEDIAAANALINRILESQK